ncbi:hypothetical protein [Jiangella alkaliphila]|uniref:hypothetical protein n=1 Tax=Jiangella alkaliphila TaxID=419479 RepID=UPI00128C8049|nr:hypothetical protein [Jiangella alkaliphila]
MSGTTLDVVRACGRCGATLRPDHVTSWHRTGDGFVGYGRCACGGLVVVRPGQSSDRLVEEDPWA